MACLACCSTQPYIRFAFAYTYYTQKKIETRRRKNYPGKKVFTPRNKENIH